MGMRENNSQTRRSFLRLSGLVGLAGFTGVTSASPGRDSEPTGSELLVGVDDSIDSSRAAVDPHLPQEARVVDDNDTLGYVAVELPDTKQASTLHHAVTDSGPVTYVEPNMTYRALYVPNDPGYDDQYADQMVNASTAWEQTLGDAGVTIGVVDQGVAYNHPDLRNNIASDPGYDFIAGDTDPSPDTSSEHHGSHVSGIAAASIDNGTGVTGIGNSTVVSARALNESGRGSLSAIANGIQYVADRGADVINLSLGGGGGSQTMDNALDYAVNQGALVVAAAGNAGQRGVSYPAANSKCLAVAALDSDGSLARYSNYGGAIELAAPGTQVLSTVPGGYGRLSGTSMACPVVAGTAGLALAQWNLTNSELRAHLKNTAVDIGLPSNQQGAGRVDAGTAITTPPQ
jgi:serine protease